MKRIHTIGDAISDLVTAYNEAVKMKWVQNPIAYALYYVWRKYDRCG